MSAKVNAPQDRQAKWLARSATDIAGTLGCYTRLIVTGRLVAVGPPDALTAQRRPRNRRCFAWGVFAEPLRDQVRDYALRLARAAGLASQPLERQGFRQAARGAARLDQRGRTGRKLPDGRGRHDYFYFLAATASWNEGKELVVRHVGRAVGGDREVACAGVRG